MDLDRAGREYVRWPIDATIDGQPDVPDTAQVRLAGTWHDAELVDDTTDPDADGPTVRLLVAGPQAGAYSANPAGTVVLTVGVWPAALRFGDNPEVDVADGGHITVL
jgi:hypothetical protein